MNDEQFTPQEQSLIERLEGAPQHRLSSTKVEAIEARILNAVDLPAPAPRPQLSVPKGFPALVTLATIIALILYVANSYSQQRQAATSEATTANNTQVAAIFTATAAPTFVTESPLASPAATTGQTLAPTSVTIIPPETIIVVEGPVRAIQGNRVTIYDLTIQTAVDDPMLTIIRVGDMAHIKGTQDKTGAITALEVSNVIGASAGSGTALVDGRVQVINGDVLTINGIKVQLPPNDLRLKTIRVGDFLSVNGDFQRQGTTVVLIVVNLVIINDAEVDIYLNCRKHEGMGMGMGMGDDSMGMGNDGMGSLDCRP